MRSAQPNSQVTSMDTEAPKEPPRHGGNVFTIFITSFAAALGMRPMGAIDSPILGADGNREFLACFEIAS